ncbi:MAG: peptidylprolyl isomerase [Clostridia bacterium]|nr:peptidylprolyl isomerase [Clostridia bacterium]
MKINGAAVDKDVLNFVTNSSGINCVYSLAQAGMISDVDNFDWNAVGEGMDLSYTEISKAMAVETLIPIYAVIAEGEKRGIEFTEEDDKKIKDWIAEQKESYGAEFEKVLKQSGYADEATLYELQKIQLYMQKVYEDIEKNLSNYVTPDIKKNLGDEKVTVKHILISFEFDEEGKVTDEAKATAKKKAEEVLAKVKNGQDFDKLVKEYNEDPGMTDEGYTFEQNGTMVKEFEDASFALKIGEVSELVETTYGYHIIKRVERAVTTDDYISVLQKTVPVNIKKGVFDKMTITINLKDYFGAPEEVETGEAAE